MICGLYRWNYSVESVLFTAKVKPAIAETLHDCSIIGDVADVPVQDLHAPIQVRSCCKGSGVYQFYHAGGTQSRPMWRCAVCSVVDRKPSIVGWDSTTGNGGLGLDGTHF